MMQFIRRCLMGGLLVWLPILATLFVLKFIVDLLDNTLSLLPTAYQPDNLLGFHLPGLGVVIAISVLFFTGLLVTNFIGKRLVHIWEYLLTRIPIVRTIYSAVKQVLETVLVPNGQAFRKVVLVKFPQNDIWSIAFVVGQGVSEIKHALNEEMVCVYVPTTPNPTSGYLILVAKHDMVELEMSVEEALKFIISLGVVQPGIAIKK